MTRLITEYYVVRHHGDDTASAGESKLGLELELPVSPLLPCPSGRAVNMLISGRSSVDKERSVLHYPGSILAKSHIRSVECFFRGSNFLEMRDPTHHAGSSDTVLISCLLS